MASPTLTIQLSLSDYATTVLADSPTGYWHLGEYTGTIANDLSTQNKDGTYTNGVSIGGTRGALPNGNAAITLDGTDDYVTMGDVAIYAFEVEAYSLECWIKKSSNPASEQILISKFQAVDFGSGYKVAITSAGKVLFYAGDSLSGATFSVTSNSAVCNGAWRHIVCTWDGSTTANKVIVYIDGVSDATGTAGVVTPATPAVAFILGNESELSEAYAGDLDEAAVYNTELSAARVLAHYNAAQWTDVSADVRMRPDLSIRYGMRNGAPTERVATTGEARFLLDNSTKNSAATAGYYSPNSASVRTGFTQGIPCRLSFAYGGTTYYKFVGRLKDIKPLGGAYGEQYTICRVLDFMDDLARANISGLTTQPDVSYDTALLSVLNQMTTSPAGVSLAAGIDTFPYALIGGDNGIVNGLQEAQRLAMSEWGYLYAKGDTTTGGTLTGENRHTRPSSLTSLTTLSDMTDIDVPSSVEDVINVAKATIHPHLVGAAAAVLYSSLAVPLLSAGESITLSGPYRDPDQKASRVAGVSMVTPVATTDYTANSASDGSGTNLTANLTVVATFSGTGVSLVVTNTHVSTPCYVTKLQCRGTGLFDYDAPVVTSRNTTSEARYGSQGLSFDMTYQDDPVSGLSAAALVQTAWSTPFGYARHVGFIADTATTLTAALAREIGDRITVTETQTGIDDDFFINRIDLTFNGTFLACQWELAPARPGASGYWSLGTAGASELGTTTRIWNF